ncbi:restriction endonuclease subunit S [Nostoc sp.]|uniref:restriction endonuclease subunit S n=1 Tax=Nostoc sp. TaxID=1180 RepID=UPI002FF8C67E
MGKKLKKNVPVLRFPDFEGDWEILTIEEIASVSSGGTPSRTEPSFWGGDIPWVTTSEISQTEIFDTAEKITRKGLKNCSAKIVEKNTILMAIYGQGKTRGQVSILRIEATTNQACAAIALKDNYNPEFTYHFLSREYESLKLLSNDGSQKNLSAALVKQYKIPLPSIAEQEKIASFLGAVDARLTQLRRKRELLQAYKRGVMQKLFTQEIRFKGAIGWEFPDWEKKDLGDITKIYDGTHQTPNYVERGVPFYSVEHLTSNNFTDTKFISEDIFLQEQKRVCLEKEDILMTRIGDIGTCRLIDWDVRASFYVSLALIKANKITISAFLAHFISSVYFQKELHKRTIHVAFPKKINLGEIGNCKTLLPCLEEQEKIANFLTAINRKIEAISRQIDQTEQFKKGLLQKMFV